MGKDWDSIGDTRQPGDPNYTDSIHTPYGRSKVRYGHGASYRGKKTGVSQQEWHKGWLEQAYRVLQPNGIIKAFSGTRTYHRLAAAMEEAGFTDIRLEAWTYGSGFPKSLNISKAIDNSAGVKREVVGVVKGMGKQNPEWNGTAQGRAENSFKPEYELTVATTEEAKLWKGWGTALKPAWEPVLVGRKP